MRELLRIDPVRVARLALIWLAAVVVVLGAPAPAFTQGTELSERAKARDANGNGISEPGELTSLSKAGITSLSCKHRSHASPHCKAFSPRGMTLRNGTTRPTYDLILYPRK